MLKSCKRFCLILLASCLPVIALATSGLLPLTSTPVHAVGEFTSSLESTYTINDSGSTHVKQVFSIKNNFSTVYASDYALEVASNRITNITVTNVSGKLTPNIKTQSNKTTISLTFPDKVIGKDQVRTFHVEYDTPDIAQHSGKTLEVNIPKLSNPKEFSDYLVHIYVSNSFTAPAVATPKDFITSTNDKHTIVTFKNKGQDTGISVLFGTEQYAKLNLHYTLENPSTSKITSRIALPADTTYQRLYYESIKPLPKTIQTDADGNWLGLYDIDPGEQLDIDAIGYARITITPQDENTLLARKPDALYTQSKTYWETHDPKIASLARELKTPHAIYDYVVKTLIYDYKRVGRNSERLGARKVLDSPTQAVCAEFTDLFIALARSAGIPARAVTGFAYTENPSLRPLSFLGDVLHAWPEYYDETTSRWIAVDPTWGNTTGGVDYFSRLDFNHIVFATHGVSSDQPYPAGMYKKNGQESKDVTVEFVDKIPEFSPNFSSELSIRPSIFLGLKNSYVLKLTNNSLQAAYAVPYTIRVKNNAGIIELSDKTSLGPMQTKEIPVQWPRGNLFTAYQTQVNVKVASQSFDHEATIKNTIQSSLPLILVTLVVAGVGGCIAFISWRLLVPHKKR